jgi:hypothetical protein
VTVLALARLARFFWSTCAGPCRRRRLPLSLCVLPLTCHRFPRRAPSIPPRVSSFCALAVGVTLSMRRCSMRSSHRARRTVAVEPPEHGMRFVYGEPPSIVSVFGPAPDRGGLADPSPGWNVQPRPLLQVT